MCQPILFIIAPLAIYNIIPIIQDRFESSAVNLLLAKTGVENVKEYLRQQEIV